MPVFLKVEDVHKTYILKRRRFFLEDDEDDDEDDDERTRGAGLNGGDAESGAPSNPEDDQHPSLREVQALRGISFEAKAGDIIGIVGSRGAGKSTLINIIARKTLPTSGTVQGSGLVVCINDMQRPLSPVFSCRRNLFMAAAMLGVKSKEIAPLVEEAADLAGAQKYLDVVVSRMPPLSYAQSAAIFALLLEPDILLIDETNLWASASGKKSFDAVLRDFIAKGDRLVLIASNKLHVISSYSDRAIWIDSGRLANFGSTNAVIPAYSKASIKPGHFPPIEQSNVFRGLGRDKDLIGDFITKLSSLNVGNYQPVQPIHRSMVPSLTISAGADEQDLARMVEITEADEAVSACAGEAGFRNEPLGSAGHIVAAFAHTKRRRGVRTVAPGEDVIIEIVFHLRDRQLVFNATSTTSISTLDVASERLIGEFEVLKTVLPTSIVPNNFGYYSLQHVIPGQITGQFMSLTVCSTKLSVTVHAQSETGSRHRASGTLVWAVRGDLNSNLPGADKEIIGKPPRKLFLRPSFDWQFVPVEGFVEPDTSLSKKSEEV